MKNSEQFLNKVEHMANIVKQFQESIEIDQRQKQINIPSQHLG